MNLMAEAWRAVFDFPLYEVSDFGRVRRLEDGKLLSISTDKKHKRKLVTLKKNGKYHTKKVHRLVAFAFLGKPPLGKELVLHSDGDASNNHVSNLRWGNHSENRYDSVKHGTHVHAKRESCPRGHSLVGENLVKSLWVKSNYRDCRSCAMERARAHYGNREFDPISADKIYGSLMGYDDEQAD